jgi:Uma2 family endonuclease
MSAMPQPTMTRQEYLAFERASKIRHEFVNGEIYAMAGASEPHTKINWNIGGILYVQFRKRDCRAYQNDMRVKVPVTGNYHYPDTVVICGEPQLKDDQFDTLLNPLSLLRCCRLRLRSMIGVANPWTIAK